MNLLEKLDSPSDLRKLKPSSLKQVAKEVRDLILKVVSEKGGHFASNLGTVELTVALHYVFNTPKDKIVWDVGHQSYPHKILTGRRDRFHTIRQENGISGFTNRFESEYDHFGAGHASTSISAALGISEGMRLAGTPHMAIAVIGDGSMTGGLAFEALNNAGHIPAKNLVVIFNDNDMAIDPNVGALSKFVNHTVTHPGYNRFRKEIRSLVDSLTKHGLPVANVASKIRKSVKTFFTPGMLFECFGFRYLGPVDGHNLDELLETLNFVQSEGAENGPYLVHVITKKGKGYQAAEDLPLKYHGVSSFKIKEGIQSSGVKVVNYQDVFADTLIKLAKEDPRIVCITAAMPSGTGLNKFQKEFPTRTYDVGIAEAHAVLFAAGLATEGYRPVAAIYSTFLQRAYDQIIHDVGIQNLPVIFAMDRGGLVGADGATHQGAFDLTYLRTVPNFVVMAPKDENELQHMIKTSIHHQTGPIALRYPRGEVVGVKMDKTPMCLPIGKGELLSSDAEKVDVTFIAVGYSVQTTLEAQKILQDQGLKTAVINARFIKPLDDQLLLYWAKRSQLVVTVEENAAIGGFGSGVLELFQKNHLQKDCLVLGLPDRFIDHAAPKAQRAMTFLDGKGISEKTLEKLKDLEIKPPNKGKVARKETTLSLQ